MKTLIIVMAILISLQAYSQSKKEEKILAVVDQEIEEIKRLYSKTGKKDGELLLRQAELYLEKTKIVRSIETEKYLSIDPEKRGPAKKYFEGSNALLEKAKELCLNILSAHPSLKENPEIFSILGYYEKEHNNLENAEKFYVKSMTLQKNPTEKSKAMLGLAENYYNLGKYNEAKTAYEDALKKIDEKWWTKDAYNLAWCYLRTGDAAKGVTTLRTVLTKSRSGKYVDMSSAVLRDIGLFFVEAGEGKEAVTFYSNEGLNFADSIVLTARKLKSQSSHVQAEKILQQANRMGMPSAADDVKIKMELLESYDFLQQTESHLKIAEPLVAAYEKGQLNADQISFLKKSIANKAVKIQKETIEHKGKNTSSAYAKIYLDLRSRVEPEKKDENKLLIAESLYAKGDFQAAFDHYVESYKGANEAQNSKVMSQCAESMLAILSNKDLSEDFKKPRYEITYSFYLKTFPKEKLSKQIYQKLFNVYFDANKTVEAENTLNQFVAAFPKDQQLVEGLSLRLIELFQKNKQSDRVRDIVGRITRDEISVSPDTKRKALELATGLQMENVQKDLKKGNTESAIAGYFEVFNSPSVTAKAKRNAAYNLAVIYYKNGNVLELSKWSNQSLHLLEKSEIEEHSETYLTFFNYLFDSYSYVSAIETGLMTLRGLCLSSSAVKEDLFKNTFLLAVAIENTGLAESLRPVSKKCNLSHSTFVEASIRLYSHYIDKGLWQSAEHVLSEIENEEEIFARLIKPTYKLQLAYQNSNQVALAKKTKEKIVGWYNSISKSKGKLDYGSRNLVASLNYGKYEDLVNKFNSEKLSFPEDHFNRILSAKLKILEKMTEENKVIAAYDAPDYLVKSTMVLIDLYRSVASDLQRFSPPGKSEDYVTSFKKSMNEIALPLIDQASTIEKSLISVLMKEDLLAKSDRQLILRTKFPVTPVFEDNKGLLMMDRGPKK